MSAFDDWLQQLAAAGRGPVVFKTCSRGRVFEYLFSLEGDWTGATIASEVRLYPDAGGAALATFNCTGPVVAGGASVFTMALTAIETAALPAAPTGEGFIELAVDVLITPSGGDEQLLFGGTLPVIGRITA